MAASSGSNKAITSSRLKAVSSCRKEVLGLNSLEDNDLITSLKYMVLVENDSCPLSKLDSSLWNRLNDNLVEKIIARLPLKYLFRVSLLSKAWSHKLQSPSFQSEVLRPLSKLDSSLWNMLDSSLWNMLNDNLVEKIIARLPFKSLFRVSLLSKTWSHKLQSPSFQSEVLLRSASAWTSYSLLFATEKKLIGYESRSQQWHSLATQSYFPPFVDQDLCPFLDSLERAWTWHLYLIAVGGSILCWMWSTNDISFWPDTLCRSPLHPFYLCVSNPLTKSWKQLPPCPHMKIQGCASGVGMFESINVHVDSQGTNAFQVFIVNFREEMWDICVSIFDSRSDIWTMENYKMKSHEAGKGDIIWTRMWNHSVYINGAIYQGITYRVGRGNWSSLISFDLENKMWSERNLSINQQEGLNSHLEQKCYQRLNSWDLAELVACGSTVMLFVYRPGGKMGDRISGRENLCVYRLDLKLALAFAVSTAPKDILDAFMKEVGFIHGQLSFYCAAGVGDCMYFSGWRRSVLSRSLMYNVTTQKWHWIPSAPDKFGPFPNPSQCQLRCSLTAYQPGLNPFLKV